MITLPQEPGTHLDVLPNSTDVLSDDARDKDLDVALPTIGALVRDDGVGIDRHRRARHDLHRSTGRQPMQRGFSSRNLPDHRQAQRRILGGLTDILSAYRITIHGRIVESRQVNTGHDVFADVEAYPVEDVLAEGA